jgi:hypothetical protein
MHNLRGPLSLPTIHKSPLHLPFLSSVDVWYGNLVLAFASTVILCLWPRGTQDYIFLLIIHSANGGKGEGHVEEYSVEPLTNRGVLLSIPLQDVLHPSHSLLNVLLQIANNWVPVTKKYI